MAYLTSKLFRGIDDMQLKEYLSHSNTYVQDFAPNEYIFYEGDPCKYFYLLMEGKVQVERVTSQGKRIIVNRFQKAGTIFGEVYVFLPHRAYDYSCISPSGAKVLFMPKEILKPSRGPVAEKLCENMLFILSNKALFLNQKLLVQGAGSLREKIARYILHEAGGSGFLDLALNREEWADYLGVARPSLSRELMKMEKEGIISLEKNRVLYEREDLEDIAY